MASGMASGSVASVLASLGMGGQVPQRRPDGAPRRVDPGDEGEGGDAQHDRSPRAAGRRPRPGAGRSAGRHPGRTCGARPRRRSTRSGPCVPSRRRSSSSANSSTARTQPVNVSDSDSGTPRMCGDHPDRDLLGVVGRRVGPAVGQEPVDQAGCTDRGSWPRSSPPCGGRTTAAAAGGSRCASAGRPRSAARRRAGRAPRAPRR